MEQITWTDITQAIASAIAVPGAIAAFIILFIKDKNKEKQIQKLSDIATHLSKMADDSEKRYAQTRKPLINTKIINQPLISALTIYFQNANKESAVIDFEIMNIQSSLIIKHPLKDIGGVQEFSARITYSQHYSDLQKLAIRYTMSEGYEFISSIELVSEKPTTNELGHNATTPSII